MKRILLFVLTNVLVVAVLGIMASLLGVNRYLTAGGLNLSALLGFALIMGFGGATISLLISKPMAKWTTPGLRVLNQPQNADEAWIVETVRKLSEKAGVVIGHEVAHIANGDMVTMTLIQGVMNTFVVFLSRVIGYAVDSFLRKGDDRNSGPGIGYMITTVVLDIVLGFAAAMVVAWFSRHREFRADAGSAQLLGRKQPMINALARLGGMAPCEVPKSVAAFGIAGGIGKLFSTHPPIEERIAALQHQQA